MDKSKELEKMIKKTVQPILEKKLQEFQKMLMTKLSDFIIESQAKGYSDNTVLLGVKMFIKEACS